jgi:hypothetical protein
MSFIQLILPLVSNVDLVESPGLLMDHAPILKDLFEPDITGCLESIKREKSPAELRGLLNRVNFLYTCIWVEHVIA